MKPARSTKTALVLIDVQNGFLHPTHWGTSRSTPQCEHNIGLLLTAARRHQKQAGRELLICHVHHHSTASDSALHPDRMVEMPGSGSEAAQVAAVEAQPFAAPAPGESVWVKHVNSAFIGTGLEVFLRAHGVRQIIFCGLTTDHCVSTSTRMAANLGIVHAMGGDEKPGEIIVVRDACATWAKGGFDANTVHAVSLASLDGEFAMVADTKDAMAGIFGEQR